MKELIGALLLTLTVIALGSSSRLFAHDGHDHKVMGTVTMAAADHVMLKDKDGKTVTVQITKDTKIVRGKQALKIEDVKAGIRIVVTAAEEKGQMKAKTIEVAAAAAQ